MPDLATVHYSTSTGITECNKHTETGHSFDLGRRHMHRYQVKGPGSACWDLLYWALYYVGGTYSNIG